MTLTTERQQFAEQNEMSLEFVNWFFDEKKDGCGNAWLIMAAAMWEGWKGREANREAQPVLYASEETLAYAKEGEKSLVTWSEPMGDAVIPLYTAPPAPAVPVLITEDEQEEDVSQGYANSFRGGWNACRAAILAQPVSGGYKLVPAEATEDMIAAAMNCDDVSFNADETFCVNFGNIYAAMLAAAPEGGNDHDTRR
ncbi:TPA: hypothetical protein ACKQIG_000926 [Serratia marcescens]